MEMEMVKQIPAGQQTIFTDDSALENPGPSGATAICYSGGLAAEPVIRSMSIFREGNSYEGELFPVTV